MHGLGAKELANARAKHLAAIGAARVRSHAGSLELQLPTLVVLVDDLAQVHGGTVAELTREVAKLIAAVAVRRRLRSRNDAASVGQRKNSSGTRCRVACRCHAPIACKVLDELGSFGFLGIEVEQQ